MKRFTLLSVSILCLALSALIGFHVGSQTVQAQAPGVVVASFLGSSFEHCVMLDNGDVYFRAPCQVWDPVGGCWLLEYCEDRSDQRLTYVGNFWGAPTPTSNDTWGGIKAQYDKKK